MYLRSCRRRKMCLCKCLKSKVLEHPRTVNMVKVLDAAEICTTGDFPDFSVTLRELQFENVCLSCV